MKKSCLIISVFCLAGCSSTTYEQNQVSTTTEKPIPVKLPTTKPFQKAKVPKRFKASYDPDLVRKHEVVGVEDSSLKAMTGPMSSYTIDQIGALPTNVRKTYRILVPANIKEKQVRPTIAKIISKIIKKDGNIDEITLFLFSDKDLATGPYDVARATWAYNGEWGSTTPEIARSNDRTGYKIVADVKPNLEKYLQARNHSEEKFGLSDEERRRIYKELVATEDKAQAEADETYPTTVTADSDWRENIGKNNQFREDLQIKYRAQLADEHNLSEKQMASLEHEGFVKNWPLD